MDEVPFYAKETDGIRIVVRPLYLPEHSRPEQLRYVFAYFVRIENNSAQTVQLMSRRWLIHDSIGEEYEVVGDGVVGEQPVITRGNFHDYQSFCILRSATGYMEGAYHFVVTDGADFDAIIPRFILTAHDMVWPTA